MTFTSKLVGVFKAAYTRLGGVSGADSGFDIMTAGDLRKIRSDAAKQERTNLLIPRLQNFPHVAS